MPLTANVNRPSRSAEWGSHRVALDSQIYVGSAVGLSAGFARPLVAGDAFLGFAEQVLLDNHNRQETVIFRRRGLVLLPLVTSTSDVGRDVYASDDDTFTLTEGGNTRIGAVQSVGENGMTWVEISTVESDVGELTVTVGTAADAMVDVGATFDQAKLNNNFASLAAKMNSLVRRLGG